MNAVTEPLREEHRHLLPHITSLRTLADSIGVSDGNSIRAGVDQAHAFLTQHLIPHAEAEDKALYPVVARILGAPNATATMSRDHVEVGRFTGELDALRSALGSGVIDATRERDLRRVLYGLYALVSVHFAKEEEIYLPLLDGGLTPGEADEMFRAMEQAAGAISSP
jgi:iron-sulfur cluster repair protein YtfE (RIC family)